MTGFKDSYAVLRKNVPLALKSLDLERTRNLFRLLWEIKTRRVHLEAWPIVMRINTFPFCNLKCPGCMGSEAHKSNPNVTRKIMSFDTYRKILDKVAKRLLLVILYDEGEPLLRNDIADFVSYTSSLRISTSISSNLSLRLSDTQINGLVCSGLSRLIVSMDGMTQEIYERYRRGGNVRLVQENVRRIVDAKLKLNLKTPTIELQYLCFGYNDYQVAEARDFARRVGVDMFRSFRAAYDNRFVEFAGPEWERIKLGCSPTWTTVHVGSDGIMYPCDFGEDHGMDPVGSLADEDFRSLWNSEPMIRIRDSFKRDRGVLVFDQCRRCPRSESLPFFLR